MDYDFQVEVAEFIFSSKYRHPKSFQAQLFPILCFGRYIYTNGFANGLNGNFTSKNCRIKINLYIGIKIVALYFSWSAFCYINFY